MVTVAKSFQHLEKKYNQWVENNRKDPSGIVISQAFKHRLENAFLDRKVGSALILHGFQGKSFYRGVPLFLGESKTLVQIIGEL